MTLEKLLKWMRKNLSYGQVDANGNVLTPKQERLVSTKNPYQLQSPSMLKQTRVGNCWDQVEFQRYFFNKMLDEGTVDAVHHFYLIQYIEPNMPTHTFTIYEQDGEAFWFENAYNKYVGINGPYDDVDEACEYVHEKMSIDNGDGEGDYDLYEFSEDKHPKYGSSIDEYMKFFNK